VDTSKDIANYAQGSTYSKAELQYLVSRWVFECHRPFAIIDDPPLQRILKMLYAKVKSPSQTMVSRDVKEIHGISKVHVGDFLQVCLSHYLLCPYLILAFWIEALHGMYTRWVRWLDLAQCLLLPGHGRSHRSQRKTRIIYLGLHLVSRSDSLFSSYSHLIIPAWRRAIRVNIWLKNLTNAFKTLGSTQRFENMSSPFTTWYLIKHLLDPRTGLWQRLK